MTKRTKIAACSVCVGVLIAGFAFERLPEPANPWLLIVTGLTIAARPFVLVGFFAAAVTPIRRKK